MKTASLVFTLAMVGASASPAFCGDLASARAFVAQLYGYYPQRPHAPPFDPAGRQAALVFDPSMIALFRENDRLTPKGDVGALDGDPICACQDDSGLVARIGAARLTGPSHATVHVDLRFSNDKSSANLDLIDVGGHWRVYDVSTKDTPSLRAYMIQSNREAAEALKREAHGRRH